MREIFTKFKSWLTNRLLPNNVPIETRLSNLIMLCTALGCITAFIFSLFINQDLASSIIIFAAFAVVCFCLYLSAWKGRPRLGSVLVILLIDEVIFPFMFVICGGIHSGMVCWLIVGLIFPFLVLNGALCYFIFALGTVTLGGCFALEYMGILKITPLENFGWVEDTVQSMILVAIIFGVIFKFQSRIYSQQNEELEKGEKELKDAMSELERASQAKSDFLANMSHEIRTPINAIMGMNEIIIRESEDDSVVQNSLKIQAASENLLSIVNDILDFSKIESGKMEIIPVDYALSSLLNDCYNIINMRAFNKGLAFSIRNNPDIPENLHGDEFHVKQIVTNLLTNAVKYTKTGSVILDIDYKEIDGENIELVFNVIDTGVGIGQEDMDKLFTSFQRIDEKHNRSIEGTGLGLVIAKKLALQMNGDVTVASIVGKGSTFTLRVPQTVTKPEKIGEFAKRYENYNKQNKKEYKEQFQASNAAVLVVDDVKMNLTVVKGLLKRTKIGIDTCLSGKEALEKCAEKKYDIILLDHMMPEMDGMETLARLKASKGINADTPVIALTANAIKGVEEEYLAAGFDYYLSKPVHGEDLEKTLLKFLPEDKID